MITNYSLIQPESTKDFIVPGDNRYELALQLLDRCKNEFSISDAFTLLHTVRQEGAWATRVSLFTLQMSEQCIMLKTITLNISENLFFRFPNEKGASMSHKIYPRSKDKETVYLKSVISNPNIIIGDYTIYNDFVGEPKDFEKNNVLYQYPINQDKLIIGKFCSIACGAKFHIQ